MPFVLGNFLSWFVPGTLNRRKVRSYTILVFNRLRIGRLIRDTYGEKIKTIKLARQISLSRAVYIINGKYFVKIFRNVSNARLREFEFLVEYVREHTDIKMPRVIVSKKWRMYVCEKVSGQSIYRFTHAVVLKNEKKILSQVSDIITKLQSINVTDIPGYERFNDSMQLRTVEKPGPIRPVLAHFDLNETNLFFDKDLNISAVIDWDTLSIARNPNTDWDIFTKYWGRYIKRLHRVK